MCHCVCKNDDHFRRADPVLEIGGTLCKDLAFTAVFFADLLILAVHAIMTADDDNTQFVPLLFSDGFS